MRYTKIIQFALRLSNLMWLEKRNRKHCGRKHIVSVDKIFHKFFIDVPEASKKHTTDYKKCVYKAKSVFLSSKVFSLLIIYDHTHFLFAIIHLRQKLMQKTHRLKNPLSREG